MTTESPREEICVSANEKTMTVDKWLLVVVAVVLGIVMIGCALLLADYFYPVVALLSICLVLTYMLLFPVNIMERMILRASDWMHCFPWYRRFSESTPEANPRILAVFLVYFVFMMTISLGLIRYVPVLSKEMRGFGDALTGYANQISSDAIDWADNTFGAHRVKNFLVDSGLGAKVPLKNQPSEAASSKKIVQHITKQEKLAIQASLLQTTTEQGMNFLAKGMNIAVLHALDLATGTVMGLVYCLSGFLLLFYFLLDGKRLARNTVAMFPQPAQETTRFFLTHFHQVMDAFIRGQVLLGICTGIYMFIVYSIFGVPYAFFLGVFMAVSECLPVVGTWLGITPAIIVMLFTFGPMKTLFIWLFSYAYQTIKDNIIAPKIVGDTMGLHPMVVILSLLLCAHFAGFLGILLALPIASILKVILQYINKMESGESLSEASDNASKAGGNT